MLNIFTKAKYLFNIKPNIFQNIPIYSIKGFEKFKNSKRARPVRRTNKKKEKEVKQEKDEDINEEPVSNNEKREDFNVNNLKDRMTMNNKNSNSNNNTNNNDNNNNNSLFNLLLFGLSGYVVYKIFFPVSEFEDCSFKELEYYLSTRSIRNIQIKTEEDHYNRLRTYLYARSLSNDIYRVDITDYNLENILSKIELIQDEFNKNSKTKTFIPISFQNQAASTDNRLTEIVINVLTSVFIIYLALKPRPPHIKQQINAMFNPSKKKTGFKLYKKSDVKFSNIRGLGNVKNELIEFVSFLKAPQKFFDIGARAPKGALLNGPPGTGKTYLAKAISGEAGVPFFYVSGSEFVEMYVGVGASRVRKLFKEARKMAPCIIFIDEIDAIGGKRSDKGHGNDEFESTLNQLLIEMDGFEKDSQIIVIGATNRLEMLDKALLRPGRFDRIVDVTLPDLIAREEIFEEHLLKKKIVEDPVVENTEESNAENILVIKKENEAKRESRLKELSKRLATLTPGFSGADIANICNEAAISAARANYGHITNQCFEESVDKIIAGLEKSNSLSKEDEEIVSVHECGHAIVSWFLKGGSPLLKLSIVPRSKGSLGFAQYLPNENDIKYDYELLDEIKVGLGGRIAEKIFNGGVITNGAGNDLQKVRQLASDYVLRYGFDSDLRLAVFKTDKYGRKIYGEEVNQLMDKKIEQIISDCTQETEKILIEHKEVLIQLKDKLIQNKNLNFKDIVGILGPRPFEPNESFKRYLEEINKSEIN